MRNRYVLGKNYNSENNDCGARGCFFRISVGFFIAERSVFHNLFSHRYIIGDFADDGKKELSTAIYLFFIYSALIRDRG